MKAQKIKHAKTRPEPDQDEDQAVQNGPTEVFPSDLTDRADRAVYSIDPRTSRLDVRPEPRPDDIIDRPTGVLSRPSRHAKADSRAKIHQGREESEDDRNFSLLDPLVCTAHPDDLASVFDPMMDFSFDHFSKERILKLSEDLTRARMQLVH